MVEVTFFGLVHGRKKQVALNGRMGRILCLCSSGNFACKPMTSSLMFGHQTLFVSMKQMLCTCAVGRCYCLHDKVGTSHRDLFDFIAALHG